MKVRKNVISTVLGFMCCLGVVSASYSADWYTIDGGWCTLIYVPIPEDIQESATMASGSTPARAESEDTVLVNISLQEESEVSAEDSSDTQPSAEDAGSEEGFKPLFNGENLEGWTVQGLEKAGPKVEDGVLVVGGWDYWAVITKEQFKNFILRFDVKFDPRGNSGIFSHRQ